MTNRLQDDDSILCACQRNDEIYAIITDDDPESLREAVRTLARWASLESLSLTPRDATEMASELMEESRYF